MHTVYSTSVMFGAFSHLYFLRPSPFASVLVQIFEHFVNMNEYGAEELKNIKVILFLSNEVWCKP